MKNSQQGFITHLMIIIISTILVIAGVLYYQNKKTVEANSPYKDPIFSQKSTADTSSCDNIRFRFNVYGASETKSDKSQCYANLAAELNDTTICNKMIPLGEGQSPYRCYSRIAVKQGNLSLCDKLPDHRSNDSKYTCYSLIGAQKHDYSICNQIPDSSPSSDEKPRCISSVARAKGECSILSSTEKDTCYLYQSRSVRLIARERLCEQTYKEQKPLTLCQQYMNKQITVQEDCNRIVDPSLRGQCVNYNLNAVRLGSPTELEGLPPMAH